MAVAPAVLTLVLATSVFLIGWRGVDQAAQVYRVLEFRAHGLMLWDSGWYGGNFPLGYSVLFPAVAAVFGLQLTVVVCAGIATWAFDRGIRSYLGARPLGTWYFAFSTLVPVAVGQWPFLAGEAAGLMALVMLQRGRRPWAVALGLLSALFSPLAAAFLAMVCLAWAARESRRRYWMLATAGVSLAAVLATGVLFPGTGPFPFSLGSLVATELLCLTALTPLVQTTPVVRLGALLYAAATLFSYVVPNPLGGNAPRLAASIGVPLLVCFVTAPGPALSRLSESGLVRWLSRGRSIPNSIRVSPAWRLGAVAIVVPFALWQWAPGRSIVDSSATTNLETQASFYQPLITELAAITSGPVRIEIPPTFDHWEAAFVAPHVSLARGWERQLDTADNPIFYTPGALTSESYQGWLEAEGVTYVALPAAPLDYAAQTEATLLRSGELTDLVPVWSNQYWQLWQVSGSPGLVTGPASLTSLEPDHLTLQATGTGPVVVRARYTTFWSVTTGLACVSPVPGDSGWTLVTVQKPGEIELTATVIHKPAVAGCPS